MYDMKGDMGGAAAVVAALVGAARLDVGVRVTGIVMATDNLPGPDATKPGEIVAARNGTTIEILDTDAEGRLVLADGLCLAAELEPDVVIDVATLTGYARTLGTHFTPMFATDDDLAARLDAAATAAGERVWRLPLIEALEEALEAPWADLRNIPDPDDAGTTAPAVFLRRFVGERRYAHLDIGETGFSAKAHGDTSKGCTGAMARTLIELVRSWA
jgi:leucyl aminopeptidase